MKYVTIRNPGKAVTIGSKIALANTVASRLFGLLGKRGLEQGCGILIRPSSGIHTFGMSFPIDVVALDKSLRVLKVWHSLAPFRFAALSLRTHSVLELAAGQIEIGKIQPGDLLTCELEMLCTNESGGHPR
jgi:uncharacterized membrane protein (UPF0127 family)